MKLILISNPYFFPAESKIINQLFENFDFTFHLRKTEANEKDFDIFISQISEKYHEKIVIHDNYKLIHKFKLKGLHFSTSQRIHSESFKGFYKSTSTHSVAELQSIKDSFDSAFISPLFPSISKSGYDKCIDKKEIISFLKNPHYIQTVALGGIDADKIKICSEMGFDGVAVLGAIWENRLDDEKKMIYNFSKIYNELR